MGSPLPGNGEFMQRTQLREGGSPPIFGVTRYSVYQPSSRDWVLSGGADPDEYRAQLWASERMAPREQVFLEWAVPIYQGFHDAHGYRHLVQHSPEMPTRWLDALRDAAATYPVLMLVPSGAWQDRRLAMARDLKRRGLPAGPAAWLRVDDDDLLATDFIDRLAPLVTAEHEGFAATFGKGLTAELDHGTLAHFGTTIQPMASMGLTFIGSHDGAGTATFPVSRRSHVHVHRHLPTLVDSREVAYLRLLHENQDRNLTGAAKNPTASHAVPDLAGTVTRLFPTVVGSSDLRTPGG